MLGLVTGVIKGGIEVDVDGLRAFAPGSHVDLRLGADLSHLVAKRLPFYVTQYAKRGRDVVLSRRAMLEEESRKARSRRARRSSRSAKRSRGSSAASCRSARSSTSAASRGSSRSRR